MPTPPDSGSALQPVVEAILERLAHDGLLLFSDPESTSVVGIVAGERVHGSWWTHPSGNLIYHVGEALEDHPDVLVIPLILRKATLVHRRLWPEVLAVGRGHEEWQFSGLSPSGRALLTAVEVAGELSLERAPRLALPRNRTIGDLGRDLERRLLVYGRSVHTETGRHAKQLASWKRWSETHRGRRPSPSASTARSTLDVRVRELYPTLPKRRRVPWTT